NLGAYQLLGTIGACVLTASYAEASEGYFQYAWGARHSALAGAGVADSKDATGQIINPSGLLSLEGSQLSLGATLFSPRRKYTGTDQPGFSPMGEVKSDSNYFLIPSIAYSQRIDENSAWGITMYGNGGMNTNYPAVERPIQECGGGSGIFCGGTLGVDFMQGFVSPTYARSFGNVSFGISPLLAFQRFKAEGLVAFSDYSSDPANLSNGGHSWSFGVGVKVGATVNLSDEFRVAASFQPKIKMGKLDKYAGLFANQGEMDIPMNWVVGVAFDLSQDVTFMADVKQIYYSKLGSVGNATNVQLPFGATGGPGFGWDDVTAYKAGIEWRQSDQLTLRAGFSTNTNPIESDDVMLNVLAPGVVKKRFTGGFAFNTSDTSAIDFAVAYVPTVSVTGPEAAPGNPGHTIKVEMYQIAVTLGWSNKF
ncbi:MAG: hydrocarbon degradation protein, partial [Kordiimonadaceae bacterium]|nr:hydrocarbon degradation protein [Kordiimonadaceae bacterium]